MQKCPHMSQEQRGLVFFHASINQAWNSWKTCRRYFDRITSGLGQKNTLQKVRQMR